MAKEVNHSFLFIDGSVHRSKPMTSSVSDPHLNVVGRCGDEDDDLGSVSVKDLTERMERKISDVNHAVSMHDLREANLGRRPSFKSVPRLFLKIKGQWLVITIVSSYFSISLVYLGFLFSRR